MHNVAYLRFVSITSGRYCLAPASLRSFGDGKKKVGSSPAERRRSHRQDGQLHLMAIKLAKDNAWLNSAEDSGRPIPPVSGLQWCPHSPGSSAERRGSAQRGVMWAGERRAIGQPGISMIRLLCAPLAQDGSGGASSLGCARMWVRLTVHNFQQPEGGGQKVTNCSKDLLFFLFFFVIDAQSYAEGSEDKMRSGFLSLGKKEKEKKNEWKCRLVSLQENFLSGSQLEDVDTWI